jgi:sialate O-acetylesterase
MIENWREAWGQGDFPFYWVQLANYKAIEDEPAESDWAELREAQSMALKLPNTGQAVIIDIGETKDIHPRNKQDVGRRLARIALAEAYGREITPSGPVYRGKKIKGSKVRIAFDQIDAGLVAPGKALKGFSIAGADSQFVWADNPVCNLYNKVGLPASPFRTDDWSGITVGKN